MTVFGIPHVLGWGLIMKNLIEEAQTTNTTCGERCEPVGPQAIRKPNETAETRNTQRRMAEGPGGPGIDGPPSLSHPLRARGSEGSVTQMAEVEPWDLPVDGAALLEAMAGVLRRYVVLPRHAAEALSLWV